MKTRKAKWLIGCGIFCVLLQLISVGYAVRFNDSRLVVPMDFNSYAFQIKDLPMLISVSLSCLYSLALFAMLVVSIGKNRKRLEKTNTTRALNPKLGWLGLLGFLGFAGFWTYSLDGSVFPFLFFLFFGFFGFYYEGKMSGTFMDERFRENAARAQLKAYKITYGIILFALIILCQGKLFGNLEYTLMAVMIMLSLALALGMFLCEYLLYRYDSEEAGEE